MYSAYGIAIDGERSWKFGNELAKNVIIFSIHNSSLSHADNRKNKFLILSEDPTYGIIGSLVHQRKILVSILVSKHKILLEFAL